MAGEEMTFRAKYKELVDSGEIGLVGKREAHFRAMYDTGRKRGWEVRKQQDLDILTVALVEYEGDIAVHKALTRIIKKMEYVEA